MTTRYDPEVIRKEAMATPVALAQRGAKVSSKFWSLYSKRESLQAQDAKDGGNRYATAFKDTLTGLGPLFVKLGQNLANRPDLVDEAGLHKLNAVVTLGIESAWFQPLNP
jgi:predicted unusual protein kinase regulating ubiquinone biosynthesis (AarF/ABC1/UbiB family)